MPSSGQPGGAFGQNYWNAAQAIAGVQVALAANSPFLFGRELWRETLITLFQRRPPTPGRRSSRCRGCGRGSGFGERWITSVFDLFEENLRLLPGAAVRSCADEDPQAALARGRPGPRRADSAQRHGVPLEPSRCTRSRTGRGRTRGWRTGAAVCLLDRRGAITANVAFYYGLVRALAERLNVPDLDPDNVRRGGGELGSRWPGTASTPEPRTGRAWQVVPGTESSTPWRLRPMARDGLAWWGVDPQATPGPAASASSRSGCLGF